MTRNDKDASSTTDTVNSLPVGTPAPKRTLALETLRKQAEEILLKKTAKVPEHFKVESPEEIQQMLHELRVHQIELEMQNDELKRTQVELDIERERYFNLYDLAPVGYCTISKEGLVLKANLTAAAMFGVPRGTLAKQHLNRFILKEDQDTFYLHCKQLFETGKRLDCELRLVHQDGAVFWARLEATQ